MLTNASQHNLTRLNYSKQHIKPHPNPSWGKPSFRVKSKMAAIIKPVIYIFFQITIISELSIVEPHIICFFHTIFLWDSICLHLKFLRCQNKAIFKVKVKLVLKCEQLAFLSAQMPKYLIYKNVNKCFST